MADARTTKILETALWRFALQGVHVTTTAEIAKLAGVGVGTFFRCVGNKEKLLQATYEFAIAQLVAPLPEEVGEAKRGEYLHQVLERWWQLTAQAALAYPEAFDLWRLVRTTPRVALSAEPLLGPFAGVVTLVNETLVGSAWYTEKGVPASVLFASLAAQWTATVDVVLRDAACQAEPALRARVLTLAYQGWWQSLGLSTALQVAGQTSPRKPRPKPKPETPLWSLVLQAVAAQVAPSAAPAGPSTLPAVPPCRSPYARTSPSRSTTASDLQLPLLNR